jgi:hypothetical protein
MIMKKCSTCKEEKSFNEFHKNSSKIDGLQQECKTCCKLRDKKYYIKYGNESYQKRSKQYSQRNKEFIKRYKQLFGKCIDCGITDYRVLQFDHTKNKSYNISDMAQSNSIQLIKNEIRKCEIRCANCHQIKTHYN